MVYNVNLYSFIYYSSLEDYRDASKIPKGKTWVIIQYFCSLGWVFDLTRLPGWALVEMIHYPNPLIWDLNLVTAYVNPTKCLMFYRFTSVSFCLLRFFEAWNFLGRSGSPIIHLSSESECESGCTDTECTGALCNINTKLSHKKCYTHLKEQRNGVPCNDTFPCHRCRKRLRPDEKGLLKSYTLECRKNRAQTKKIERFGKFKNKNVSNQTWKAWETWFATVRSAYNKFYHLLQAWLTYHNGLRTRYSDWNPWLKRLKLRSRFVNHSKKNRKTLDSHRYVVLIGSFFVKTKNLTQSFSSVFLFRSWAWLNLRTKRSRTVLLLSNLEALNVKDRWR